MSLLRFAEPHIYTPVDDSLVLWISGAGRGVGSKVFDLSRKGNHGTIYGACWKSLPSGHSVLSFDGVDDYTQVPYLDVFNQKPFTVVAWIWRGMEKEHEPIFSAADAYDTDRYLHCLCKEGNPYLGFWGDDLKSPTKLKLRRWYCLTFVWEGPTTRKQVIYIDGEKDCERVSTGLLTVVDGHITGYGEWIGRFSENYYVGFIAEVRIYNKALSAEEIRELYNRTKHLYRH